MKKHRLTALMGLSVYFLSEKIDALSFVPKGVRMKRFLIIVAAVFFIINAASGPCLAKKSSSNDIDFSKLECGELIKELKNTSDKHAVAYLFMWLDGYLSGVTGDTVLNKKSINEFMKNLVTYCQKNSGAAVLDASKKVGIE